MTDVLGSTELVEFSFISKVASGVPTSALLRLARQSWSFNLRMGLTGTLRLIGDTFSEEIEGPCEVVQPLAARILADDRHGAIRISAFRRLDCRRHASWSTSGFDLGRAPGVLAAAGGVSPANIAFLQSPAIRARRPVVSAGFGAGLG
ncbi:MAG: BLUF domain-containing protein [Amaricoccus sp.]|uniref:BLUF domain-containing protein n=1 Tax=Amaricoccus sp. TaxID=1872485 RepID=UPI0039E4F6D4